MQDPTTITAGAANGYISGQIFYDAFNVRPTIVLLQHYKQACMRSDVTASMRQHAEKLLITYAGEVRDERGCSRRHVCAHDGHGVLRRLQRHLQLQVRAMPHRLACLALAVKTDNREPMLACIPHCPGLALDGL